MPTRSYDVTSRRHGAAETNHAILREAKRLFVERGYASTTMSAIAQAAGVALDTVYASVGKKPALFQLLIESAISGEDTAVPALEREYVKQIRNEKKASKKLTMYAHAVCAIQPRLAPLFHVLETAAGQDERLAAIWKEICDRRARNMRLFARELEATGELRPTLSLDVVADVIWTMNSPEYYRLLVEQRGWTVEYFERWLAEAWCHLLLQPQPGGGSSTDSQAKRIE